ncbi:acetyltransferase [Vibrio breoganii]
MNNSQQKIVIVGAGGLGREIFSYVSVNTDKYHVVGFIDENLNALDGYDYPVSVIGKVSTYEKEENIKLLLAIMSPATKEVVVSQLKARGHEFASYISPHSVIGHNVKLGEGCIITPNCMLTADISIGDFVFVNTASTIGHDSNIEDFVSINGKVEICGNVFIGKSCLIGGGVIILPEKKIVSGTMVGAGSVVVGNIRKPMTVFGNPAKKV